MSLDSFAILKMHKLLVEDEDTFDARTQIRSKVSDISEILPSDLIPINIAQRRKWIIFTLAIAIFLLSLVVFIVGLATLRPHKSNGIRLQLDLC